MPFKKPSSSSRSSLSSSSSGAKHQAEQDPCVLQRRKSRTQGERLSHQHQWKRGRLDDEDHDVSCQADNYKFIIKVFDMDHEDVCRVIAKAGTRMDLKVERFFSNSTPP